MIPDINRDYPITFRLTQGFSGEQELCLPVSRFQVTDGDRTAYYWTDKRGRKRKKVMPPYFISNMRVARNNIRQFLDSTRESYVVSLLEGSNPLVRRAFAMAMSHAAGGKVCQPEAPHSLLRVLIIECIESPRVGGIGHLGRSSPDRVSLASILGLQHV
jgi:hypothetical protein